MSDFTGLVDLADRRLGAGVVAANDEFFADKDNLLRRDRPVFDPAAFTGRGKLMDGWETRRRRGPDRDSAHDWAIVRLGAPGIVAGVVVDTAHFRGNYPEAASIEACAIEGQPSPADLVAVNWHEIVARSPLTGDSEHRFSVADERRWTHVRLSIYPDGGIARLRVHGDVVPDPRQLTGRALDLAATEAGGVVVDCSDRFYSDPASLLLPDSATTMGQGWETRRRRGPGNDWVLLRLGASGVVHQVVVDTTHFKGNAPGECRITGCDSATDSVDDPAGWSEILPRTALEPDTVHRFAVAAMPSMPATHVRLDIYPDGGLSRVRMFGELTPAGSEALGLAWLNALPEEQAERVFLGCNAAPAWAGIMETGRPYSSHADVVDAAHRSADVLSREDWLAAFAAHPRIGALGRLSAQSRREQAGAQSAPAGVLAALDEANQDYEQRFDHVFLICASGMGAGEVLAALRSRLSNGADAEWAIATAEHRKITDLRLGRLVGSNP